MKIKCIVNDKKALGDLTVKRIYDVISIEGGWYRIDDDSGEDYIYPPELFEIVEDHPLRNADMDKLPKARLLTDKYKRNFNLRQGDIGTILEQGKNGDYLLNFTRQGETYVLKAIPENEVELV